MRGSLLFNIEIWSEYIQYCILCCAKRILNPAPKRIILNMDDRYNK